jgi:Tol biopolymer transport system component/DNA-binding winged helix-turn-helix (wHTH) protein
MAELSQSGRKVFGPFEADPAAGELLSHGVRVHLSGQPFRILTLLLSHPGEVIPYQRFKEEIWGDGTFVDFEHGLHAAMNKLRRALHDSAENPRYVETVPGRGYRFIGHLERATPSDAPPVTGNLAAGAPAGAELKANPALGSSRRLWWIAAAVCLAIAPAVAWRLWHSTPAPPPWKLTKLTSDGGQSDSPALSRDGRLVVYSSQRQGARDLYLKQVAGGLPIQLTFDGEGNDTPDFSPDTSKIVFRSNRDGGGVYERPALGGEPRLLARDGRNPRYSPDGTQVAFWIGAPDVAPSVPGNGTVWVVSSAGGQPVRVGSEFTTARNPIWSPDGRRLLAIGYRSQKVYELSSLDWWILPADGSAAIKTGIGAAIPAAGLRAPGGAYFQTAFLQGSLPEPSCWLPDRNRVIFSARNGDTSNIWQTQLSAEGKATGAFLRLTAGSGNEVTASCSLADTLAFANSETSGNVWSLPFDLIHGTPNGTPEQLTLQPYTLREGSSISRDGRYLAFSSAQSGVLNVWLHDAATGNQTQLAPSPFVQLFPAISPSGGKVAYSGQENDKRILYVAAPGGVPERLCDGCLRPTDWSRDEKTLLTFGGSPYRVSLLDLASHQQTSLLAHPTYSLVFAHFSPDNRWIGFTARIQPNRAWIMIAPIDGPRPVPESSWIKISEEEAGDNSLWSPDGKILYFTSGRDGHVCLWARRIDPGSHQPSGAAFAVQHFHERPFNPVREWSAAGGRIAVTLQETTGNIWLMSRAAAR